MNATAPAKFVLIATALLALSSSAQAIPISVANVSLSPGSGYGVDATENSHSSLLDVAFTSSFSLQTFTLGTVNQAFTFDIAKVTFKEPTTNSHGRDGQLSIVDGETDNLNVDASFVFTDPLGITTAVKASGTAQTGKISDGDGKGDGNSGYTLMWDPVLVNFGEGGQFSIDLLDLSFTDVGTLTETATIRLMKLPEVPAVGVSLAAISPAAITSVPEPASLALMGLGFAGLLSIRNRARTARKLS